MSDVRRLQQGGNLEGAEGTAWSQRARGAARQPPQLSREAAPCLGSEPASDMPHFIQRRWAVPVPPTLLSTLRSTDNHT